MSDPFANLPKGHYGAILADSPWAFQTWWSGRSSKLPSPKKKFSYSSRATVPAYEVMREAELNALPVGQHRVLCFGNISGGRGMITIRYVLHHLVPSYLQCGWMFTQNFGDLGLPHSQYSAGMVWPCSCKVREPRE